MLCLFFFTSCRKQIAPDDYNFEEQICVNALLIADSSMVVHVSKAEKMGDSRLSTIEDAQVSIYNDEDSYTLVHTHSGMYSTDIPVRSNTSYSCRIDVDGETITANCKIPEQAQLLSVRLSPGGWVDEEGISMPLFELELDNTASDTLYYQVYVYSYSKRIMNSGAYKYDSGQSAEIFSNEGEEGSSFTKQIRFWRNTWGGQKTYAYLLEIRALNKDAYLYLKSKNLYDFGRFPEFGVTSPVTYNIYDNIENGAGIFAGYSAILSDTLYEIKPGK